MLGCGTVASSAASSPCGWNQAVGSVPCSILAEYSKYLTTMNTAPQATVIISQLKHALRWLSCAARTAIAIVHELSRSTQVFSAPSFQLSRLPQTAKVSG